MGQPVNDWFGTISGAAPKGTPAFPVAPDPSSAIIVPAGYISPGCADCPKRDDHHGWLRFDYSTSWRAVPGSEKIPGPEFWQKLYVFFFWANYIAGGVEAIDTLYNAGAANNFTARTADYVVASVSGANVTVEYGSQDPQNLLIDQRSIENPNWPDGGGYLITTAVMGRLQHMDFARFESGWLGGRTYVIKSISRNAGAGTATFELDQDVSLADVGDVFRLYRHVIAPPEYRESKPNLPLVCGDVSQDAGERGVPMKRFFESPWPTNFIFDLLDGADAPGRICSPRLKGNAERLGWVQCSIFKNGGWIDITPQCISEGRFVVNQVGHLGAPVDNSKLYLGAVDAHGNAQASVMDDVTRVSVEYWIEVADSEDGIPVDQRYCQHATIAGPAGAYAGTDGIDDDAHPRLGYAWTCKVRHENPTGLARFRDQCMQPGYCNRFTPAQPMRPCARDFNRAWMAFNVRLVQDVPGIALTHNFRWERLDHPSLGYLAGLFRAVAPVGFHPRVAFWAMGTYGRIIEDVFTPGAFWNELHPWDDTDFGTRDNVNADMLGLFPSEVTGWKDARPDPGDENEVLDDTSDPDFQFRATPPRQIAGYVQDDGQIAAGRDQADEQRMAAHEDQVLVPAIAPSFAENYRPRAILYNKFYGANFNEVATYAEATYYGMIALDTYNDQHGDDADQVIVEGTVIAAGSEDGKVWVDIALGPMSAGTRVSGQQYDRITNWVQGGNFVALPTWALMNNIYSGSVMDGQWSKCVRGLAVQFPDHPVHGDKRFFVAKARPCHGTPPATGNIPADVVEAFPFQARRVIDGATVTPYVTEYTDADPDPIASIVEEATPANVLTRVAMAKSPTHGGEAKFEYDAAEDEWINQADGADIIAGEDFEATGVPPGAGTKSSAYGFRLADGEYFAGLIIEPDSGEARWTVRFSQDQTVLDLTINKSAGVGGGSVNIDVSQCDVFISDEIYNSLLAITLGQSTGANGQYVGLYISSLSTLTKLTRTNVTTPKDWWTSGATSARNQFCLIDIGVKLLRLHNDLAGIAGQIYIPATAEFVDTAAYYSQFIEFHDGRPAGHADWSDKPDRVWFINEQTLFTSTTELIGQRIQATCNVMMSPEHDAAIETDVFANESTDWAAVSSGNYKILRAWGRVFLEKVWRSALITESPQMCIKVTGRFADRALLPSSRLFNAIVKGVEKTTRVACVVGGEAIIQSKQANWVVGPTTHTCCPSGGWAATNPALGTTKPSIHALHSGSNEHLLILDSPDQGSDSRTCGANADPWEAEVVEDEGILSASPDFDTLFDVGAVAYPDDPGAMAAFLHCTAPGFDCVQIQRIPDGATIVAAGCEIKLSGLELTTWTKETGEVPVSDIDTSGNITLLLVGKDKAGTISALQSGAAVAATSDEWVKVDITAIAQSMYANKGLKFAISPSPEGYDVAEIAQTGKASMLGVRNKFSTATFLDNSDPCSDDSIGFDTFTMRRIKATGLLVRSMWVEYNMGSDLTTQWVWCHHNLPGIPAS